MPRSVGVTISAVVVFIGSAFTVFFGALMVLGGAVLLPSNPVPKLPANVGYVVIGEAVFAFACAGWGIATGVGLINTRQWARISMLVFAALLIFFSVPAALIVALIQLPATTASDLPPGFPTMMRIGMATFYAMFGALGGWWLYFFNKRNVREQFRGKQAPAAGIADLSAEAPAARLRSRPISITIIGWFLLVGGALTPLFLLVSHSMFPGVQMPMCFLGFFLFGRSAIVVLVIWMAIQVIAAVGLLKLKNWGRLATIGLECLGIVNAVLLLAVPADRLRFQQLMESMVASMNASMPQPVPFVFHAKAGLHFGGTKPRYRLTFLGDGARMQLPQPRWRCVGNSLCPGQDGHRMRGKEVRPAPDRK